MISNNKSSGGDKEVILSVATVSGRVATMNSSSMPKVRVCAMVVRAFVLSLGYGKQDTLWETWRSGRVSILMVKRYSDGCCRLG